MREITRRRGQRAFRDGLLRAYEGRCAITDCDVKDVLEAAHIVPYLGPMTNRTDNGLLWAIKSAPVAASIVTLNGAHWLLVRDHAPEVLMQRAVGTASATRHPAPQAVAPSAA